MEVIFLNELFWSDFRAARNAKRLSQKAVGALFGVKGAAVGEWERKMRTPSAVKFLAICKAFNLDANKYSETITPAPWDQPELIVVDQEEQKKRVERQSRGPWLTDREILMFMGEALDEGFDHTYHYTVEEWQQKWDARLAYRARMEEQKAATEMAIESARAAQDLSYAEWREAGYGSYGMSTPEEWQ